MTRASTISRKAVIPEAVDPSGRRWLVRGSGNVPNVNFTDLRVEIPLGLSPDARALRAHELAHVCWTPAEALKETTEGIPHDLVNAVEDGRINSLLQRAGVRSPYWPDSPGYSVSKARTIISDTPMTAAQVRACVEGTGQEEEVQRWVEEFWPDCARFIEDQVTLLSETRASWEVTAAVAQELHRVLGSPGTPIPAPRKRLVVADSDAPDKGEESDSEAPEGDEMSDLEAILDLGSQMESSGESHALSEQEILGLESLFKEPERELTDEERDDLSGLMDELDRVVPASKVKKAQKSAPMTDAERERKQKAKAMESAPWRERPAEPPPATTPEEAKSLLEEGPPSIEVAGEDEIELATKGMEPLMSLSKRRSFDRSFDSIWCPMVIDKPGRPWRMPKGRGRGRNAGFYGRHPRYPQRMLSDRRIFSSRQGARTYPGTVLIDCSGSMHLSVKEVEAIMEAYPAAEIRAYASDARIGVLRLLARDGRRVPSHLVNLNDVGGGNGIDGPALQWLARMPRPRFWVSDGVVTGLGENSTANLFEEAVRTAAKARIIRVDTVGEFLRRFGASGA